MKTIFCFDSSALIRLHNFYGPELIPEIWDELENLFITNQIISHRLVFDELTTNAKNPDNLSKWITSKRQYFKSMTGTQAQYVSEIISEFPGLIDPNSEKDQADPWLIALVLEERKQLGLFASSQEFIVISEESEKSPQKIPSVCKRHNIRHFNLKEFFGFNGWILKLEKP